MGTIAKVTAGGSTHLIASTAYATCATGAATAAKVATIQDSQAFTLVSGVTIHVKFTYSNTAASPTLNVNSTGAKNIYQYGTTVPGQTAETSWQAGSVVSFTYDGSYWQMNGQNSNYLPLSGGTVTGATSFGDTVSIVDATAGTLVVTGNASFTNNISANTINGVTVGDSPAFTDEKLKVAAVTSGTAYYPIVGSGTTAATRQYDTTGFKYTGTNGTTSVVGSSVLELGNSTASGTANNKQAKLVMYGSNAKKATITLGAPSADVSLALPTSNGTIALVENLPSVTASATTGISIADHSSTTIYGVGSTTTTASHVKSGGNGTAPTLGTAISVPNVTGASDVTVPIKNASATTVPIKNSSATSIPNVTAVGSGSASLTFTMDTTDTKKLKIAFSHTHTAPTLGTAISIIGVQSSTTSVTGVQSSTTTASKVTLGTALSIPNVTSVGSASTWAFEDITVPIKNNSSTTVVTSKTHSVTDTGHTHSI